MKIINSSFVRGIISLQSQAKVQISIVAYEHQSGIPARFCAGLLAAIDLYRQLDFVGLKSIIRVIDPTPIANYCNGWQKRKTVFRTIVSDFLNHVGVEFFFDEAEQVTSGNLAILREVGLELESPSDGVITDLVQRIKESGRKHGGDAGAGNAVFYMAAHSFSWLDMYHPLIWKTQYSQDLQLINLMSRSEERFSVIRKFLQEKRPDLSSGLNPDNYYTTLCSTPCYIPLEGEPLITDLEIQGHDWCLGRYNEIRKRSSNHERVCKDFRTLVSFR